MIKADNKKEAGLHPTQKPVALMEYLIKTYTNENETVLDFTMGSGTTGLACLNTGRQFVGVEMDPEYFAVAVARLEQAIVSQDSDLFGVLPEEPPRPEQPDFVNQIAQGENTCTAS